jgi:hypothetical protein
MNNTTQDFEIAEILGHPQIISRAAAPLSNLYASEAVRSAGHHQHDENMDIEEELKDEVVSPKKLIKSQNIHVDGGSQSSPSRKSAAKAVSMRQKRSLQAAMSIGPKDLLSSF